MPKNPRKNPEFQRLEKYVDEHQTLSLPSANKIAEDLGLNVPTVSRWLYMLGWRWVGGQWIRVATDAQQVS